MNTERKSRCCFAEVEVILNEKREIVEEKRINPDIYCPPPKEKPKEYLHRCKKCGKYCDYDYVKTK